MRIFSQSIAALTLLLSIGTTQAALVNFTLTGEAVYADAGNDFGLSSGSIVTVEGSFDDSVLTGGLGTVEFSSGSANSFTIYAGNYTYSNADDDSFLSGFPQLRFEGAPLPYLDFGHNGVTGFTSDGAGFFDAYDASFQAVSGVWTEYDATVVPVPAAVWLLGSGLMGLVGVARRRQAASSK
ncbi:MAG: VPLPA-CTERM sorting domain-containing protein [Thiohalobacteraceae bacterium]